MMMDFVDEVGGVGLSVRLWWGWVGLVVMFLDYLGLYFSDNILDVSNNDSFEFVNIYIWKWKEWVLFLNRWYFDVNYNLVFCNFFLGVFWLNVFIFCFWVFCERCVDVLCSLVCYCFVLFE